MTSVEKLCYIPIWLISFSETKQLSTLSSTKLVFPTRNLNVKIAQKR